MNENIETQVDTKLDTVVKDEKSETKNLENRETQIDTKLDAVVKDEKSETKNFENRETQIDTKLDVIVKDEKSETKNFENRETQIDTKLDIVVKDEKTETENVEKQNADSKEIASENDPYAYLNREFTSENFKIEVRNLPKYYGINELKKLINDKLKLASNKIKAPRKSSPWLYVCFRNDEDRKNAIDVLTGFKWKGKILHASEAKPMPDPLVFKRKNEHSNKQNKKKPKLDDGVTQEEHLKNTVIPYWKIPYEEQLQMKQDEVKKLLIKLANDLIRSNNDLKPIIEANKEKYDNLVCELLPLRHAALIDGYRNKCEFTIGKNEETQLPTVGFRLGSYVNGFTGVAPIDHLVHIPKRMKIAVEIFEQFVRDSSLEIFNPELQSGHFRQLTARLSNFNDQLMLIVGIHPQQLTQQEIAAFQNDLIQFFTEGEGKKAQIQSLYYQPIVKRMSNQDVKLLQHLHGATHIEERLFDLKFRISPEAFFQVNSTAAEILYASAIELAAPNANTTILDVCCGTGTIGLCFAKECGQVLGLELVPQAVSDAKLNAQNNEIENSEFFTGRAEEILTSVMYRAKNDDVIAIVDPPRAGLHNKAIVQLRKMKKLKKIIYISCDSNAAYKNFLDLSRPESKTMHGDPFLPKKAVAVDLFPHTKHCELILYFERYTLEENT